MIIKGPTTPQMGRCPTLRNINVTSPKKVSVLCVLLLKGELAKDLSMAGSNCCRQ